MAKENKTRIFNILLYPDNAEHLEVIFKLTNLYKSVGIKHDKDVYEKDVLNDDLTIKHSAGELKKAHYHFVVQFENPRYASGVAKELGIDERFVEATKFFSSSKQYLLHWGTPEKYQYDTNELVGVLSSKLIKQLTELTEESQIEIIVNYIDTCGKYLNMRSLYDFCIKNGCFPTYRRCYTMLSEFIFLHNDDLNNHRVGGG